MRPHIHLSLHRFGGCSKRFKLFNQFSRLSPLVEKSPLQPTTAGEEVMMDQTDSTYRNQIAALLRVLNVTTCLKDDKSPCEIEQGLFLGSIAGASNKNELKSKNITHILTVANSLAPAYQHDFIYKVVGVSDREDTNLSQYFDECIDFIDEAKRQGGSVLVHCFMGISRSVTIVVAYLMKKRGMSLSQALEHVKSRRPVASPNSGFISQLQELEKSLQAGGD